MKPKIRGLSPFGQELQLLWAGRKGWSLALVPPLFVCSPEGDASGASPCLPQLPREAEPRCVFRSDHSRRKLHVAGSFSSGNLHLLSLSKLIKGTMNHSRFVPLWIKVKPKPQTLYMCYLAVCQLYPQSLLAFCNWPKIHLLSFHVSNAILLIYRKKKNIVSNNWVL